MEEAAVTHRQPAPTGQHLPCSNILAGPLCDHEQDHHVHGDGDRISSLGVPAGKQQAKRAVDTTPRCVWLRRPS